MRKRMLLIWRTMTGEKVWITAAGLILFGFFLRLLFLETLPYGLNSDEASSAYDAWALLQSGMDRNGKSWPVLFISWGSGQNTLMSYLAIPWIALLGLRPLSIRLPNAIAGCMTLFFMWRLACHARGKRFGLCALFLLVINPWHIMASRWGLESNLLPMLLWGACAFLSSAKEKPQALIGAALCLSLAPYAYGTVYFLLMPFLLWTLWEFRGSLKLGWSVTAIMVFAIVIFPISLCQARNVLGLGETHLWSLTLPMMTENRQNATSVFGEKGLSLIPQNISALLSILHNGDDGHPYNAMPFWQGGIFYWFGLPLAILGIIESVKERQNRHGEWPVMALLCCSLFCAAMIKGNINRLNMLWLPLIYYSASGSVWLIRHLHINKPLSLVLAMVCFLYFEKSYISTYTPPGNEEYCPGLGEAIVAAEEMEHETIYITNKVGQSYIHALFWSQTSPARFVNSVVYPTPEDAFREADRFDGFEFKDSDASDLQILFLEEAEDQGKEILGKYGSFALCR